MVIPKFFEIAHSKKIADLIVDYNLYVVLLDNFSHIYKCIELSTWAWALMYIHYQTTNG